MQTVIGAFDDEAQAQRAVDRLVAQDGFDRSDVHVEHRGAQAATTVADSSTGTGDDHRGGFFARLFGMDESDTHAHHAGTYNEAVRRGSAVVVVDARDEQQAARAVECLHECGAVDVDERARQWQSEGWSGGQPQALQARQGASTGPQGDLPLGKEGVMDVVQEELQVGKRNLDKGGVRVIQRVTERPVHEVVRLREEHVNVDRRPVDRPAQAGDLGTFKEGTVEVRESAEEAVVAKRARVVEEVRVSKDVQEREQVIDDTVRRKDVEVERLAGDRSRGTQAERERAVAAGERDRPADPLRKDGLNRDR